MTADLMALADWLDSLHVVQIAMESTGVYTPPPILPIGGGKVKREWNGQWTHAEDDADLLLIDLNAFDQGTDNIPARLTIRLVQPILHLSRKGLQTP